MNTYSEQQRVKQLEKRKGGYYYLKLDAEIVNQFDRKKATRVICTIDEEISFRCGFNHLGDGNFYVIIATRVLKQLGKEFGEEVNFKIERDPDQLGVEMPEVLEIFLEQEPDSKEIFEKLTDGKKRSLIYSFNKLKNIDKQIQIIRKFLGEEEIKIQKNS